MHLIPALALARLPLNEYCSSLPIHGLEPANCKGLQDSSPSLIFLFLFLSLPSALQCLFISFSFHLPALLPHPPPPPLLTLSLSHQSVSQAISLIKWRPHSAHADDLFKVSFSHTKLALSCHVQLITSLSVITPQPSESRISIELTVFYPSLPLMDAGSTV